MVHFTVLGVGASKNTVPSQGRKSSSKSQIYQPSTPSPTNGFVRNRKTHYHTCLYYQKMLSRTVALMPHCSTDARSDRTRSQLHTTREQIPSLFFSFFFHSIEIHVPVHGKKPASDHTCSTTVRNTMPTVLLISSSKRSNWLTQAADEYTRTLKLYAALSMAIGWASCFPGTFCRSP